MDYYEEFGVDRTAAVDDIRKAYRRLMRLLHPDQCADDTVRPLAELQVKRLNGILEVLVDPDRRRAYDCELAGRQPAPARLPAAGPRPQPWYWLSAGAAVLVFLVLLFANPPKRTAARPLNAAPATTTVVAARKSRTAAPRSSVETSPENESSDPGITAMTPPPAPLSPEDVAPVITREAPLPPPELPAETRTPIAGEWLFAPTSSKKVSTLYPPEYIELRIAEDGGLLRGRYRAKYHVADRAISPAVEFQFMGKGGPETARMPWEGPGGATGEVTLHLLSGQTLEVSWIANRLGSDLGLISGTATLVRKAE